MLILSEILHLQPMAQILKLYKRRPIAPRARPLRKRINKLTKNIGDYNNEKRKTLQLCI